MVVAIVLLVVGGGLFWAALAAADGDFSLGGPRLAPVLVTGLWVIIAALNLIRSFRVRPPAPVDEPASVDDPASVDEPASVEKPSWIVPLVVVACLAGFAVALEYAGFVISAALFILVVSRVLGSRSWVRDVIVAVVLPLAIYFPFTRLLDIFLPAGVFPL